MTGDNARGPRPDQGDPGREESCETYTVGDVRVDGDGNSVVGAGSDHNAVGKYAKVYDQRVFIHGGQAPARRPVRVPLAMLFVFVLMLCGAAAYAQANGEDVTDVWLVTVVVAASAVLFVIWTHWAGVRQDRGMGHAAGDVTAREHLIGETDRLWVRGALHNALERSVRLEIGLADQPDAVRDPYGSVGLQDLTDGELMPEARLSSLLGERGRGRSLVIGDPGAGKTTHLLSLAEDQLEQARRDDLAAVPVVLLLSTWAKENRESRFADWICAEARQRYVIDTATMTSWLRTGRVLLLLDGLDEVTGEAERDQCLADLETFCTDPQFSSCGVVITCRTDEFRELGRRVSVSRAVRVLPLSEAQVGQVLSSGGDSTAALALAVREDDELAALLRTPLMLGVAVLAFARLSPGTRMPAGDHRDVLFGLYVHRMLVRVRALRGSADRSGATTPPTPEDTYYHLVWLARLMTRQGQTIFYPDLLTPMWLPDRNPAWPLTRQRGPVSRIAGWLGWDHTSTGLVGGRLAALVGALSSAPLGALVGGSRGALAAAAVAALVLGGGVALSFGVLFQSALAERLFTPVVGHDTYGIYAASSWTWSPRRAGHGLITWLLFGGLVGSVLLLAGASAPAGLSVAGVLGLGGVLSGGTVPDHTKPPAGTGGALDASVRRLLLLLSVLLGAVTVGAVLLALLHGSWHAPVSALPVTMAFMLTAGPGRAWLRHRAAHYGARKSRLLPRDLDALMLRGEDRVLLRRVGGGYMFLHRDLQKYLTERSPEQPPQFPALTTA
ncbi:NACHT domain-containing protein [Kitasatospora sp. NPDC088346]|uniref:NACHT domain-containing protein n=1 Tax=Kitasatospora sp. NPDC088346 TaxID=3364073 RepID=UPI003823854E